MIKRLPLSTIALALLAVHLPPAAAQSAPAAGQQVPEGYTLKVNSRLIATDPAKPGTETSKLPRGTTAYSIRYSVPADELTQIAVDGQQRVVLGLVAIAFNDDGLPLAREAQKMTLAVNAEKLRLTPHASVTVQQRIDLKKETSNHYLAVWDMRSGRLGTLQIRMDIPKPK